MNDHERVLLRDIAEPTDGAFVDGPFGSNLKSDEYVDAGVRLIQLQNIGDGYWKDDNKKYITDLKFRSLSRHGAIPGDIAIAKMADPVARACIVPRDQEQYVVVADCIRLRVDEARFDPGYIVRAINSHWTRTEAEKKSIGSTRVRINLGTLKTVGCLVPPLHQQRAIVEVLDTLDDTIRQTEAIVEKLKQVKQGLLHDLLTRGIDSNGELRPPQSQAPHLYKHSPLGWIPREWVACTLAEAASYQNGAPFPSSDYRAEGVALLRPGNFRDDDFVSWTKRHTTYLPSRWMTDAADYLVYGNEIVMNLTAQSLEEGFLGRVCLTPSGTVCLLNQRIARFRSRAMDVGYLFWALKSRAVREQVDRLTQGTKVQHLYNRNIDAIVLPVPSSSDEQRAVSAALFAFGDRLKQELEALAKLGVLKVGLMDDLLTGRVRVTPLLA